MNVSTIYVFHSKMKSSESKVAPDIQKQVSNLQWGFTFGFGLNCGGGKKNKKE